MKVLVTGGTGFIGSALVPLLLRQGVSVVNLDKLTYAGASPHLDALVAGASYMLEVADMGDGAAVARVLQKHRPDAVLHLAGETHVDRSIDRPDEFVRTNLLGALTVLEATRAYWQRLPTDAKSRFRFHHVSTAEVFGSLGPDERADEGTPYRPSSPYAASKASVDHLTRAWFRTFGLPVLTTHCPNNYGPRQFPEKLVPLLILNALEGRPLPIYGAGANVHDWLYAADHAAALSLVLQHGEPGETYNISGGVVQSNLELVHKLCAVLDAALPHSPHRPHADLIKFVADRPGHDLRYAVDDSKLRRQLGWRPQETIESGLEKTVRWYLDNRDWWEPIRKSVYRGERLGRADTRAACEPGQ